MLHRSLRTKRPSPLAICASACSEQRAWGADLWLSATCAVVNGGRRSGLITIVPNGRSAQSRRKGVAKSGHSDHNGIEPPANHGCHLRMSTAAGGQFPHQPCDLALCQSRSQQRAWEQDVAQHNPAFWAGPLHLGRGIQTPRSVGPAINVVPCRSIATCAITMKVTPSRSRSR